jgi:small secreted domain DUF320
VQIKTRIAGVLAVTAAGVAMIGGPAFAGSPHVGNILGNGNLSIASGNNVQIPVSVPVNVCGVAVSILGFSDAGCQGGAASAILFDNN